MLPRHSPQRRRGIDVALPLYKTDRQHQPRLARAGHAGLWFDKFCNRWTIQGSVWGMSSVDKDAENPKLGWIKKIADHPVGAQDVLAESTARLVQLVRRRGGRCGVFTTQSRFVTGLGRSHPVENGFAWHPTLGTPYLPGSSIKGLVHAWAQTETDRKIIPHLFGKQEQVGHVCFLDAVPVKPVTLETDIMTPHYGGWSPDDPPGDWRSPTPIPFLVTAAHTPFLFGIVPPPRDGTGQSGVRLGLVELRFGVGWGRGQDGNRIRAIRH